jgi:hypothetical protein
MLHPLPEYEQLHRLFVCAVHEYVQTAPSQPT